VPHADWDDSTDVPPDSPNSIGTAVPMADTVLSYADPYGNVSLTSSVWDLGSAVICRLPHERPQVAGLAPFAIQPPPFPSQQPKNQPTPRRTELRHGAFPGEFSAVRLGLRCPLSSGAFFGLRAGRSPASAPRSGAGGGAGGGTPPPQRFLRSCWAGEATTRKSAHYTNRHAPQCPPKTVVSTPLHLPLSTRLDEISCR
jgi:hypothetical protein